MPIKNKKVSKVKVKKTSEPQKLVVPAKLEVKLITYTIRAMIPTMMYGNIAPEIVVEARSMEDAKRAVMPHIEELFHTYLEEPRDGRPARFMAKANVEVSERKVAPKEVTKPATVASTPKTEPVKAEKKEEPKEPETPKSPAYEKALKAINGATSKEALELLQDQVQNSVKLLPEEKPMLYELVLKRKKEF